MGGISCKEVFTEAEMDRSAQGLGRTSRLDFSAHDVDSIATAPRVKEPLISLRRATSKRLVID